MSASNGFSPPTLPHDTGLPLDDFEAWLLRRLIAHHREPIEGSPISDWLRTYLNVMDVRTDLGQSLILNMLSADALRRFKLQDPRSSEPILTRESQPESKWHILHASQLDQLPPLQWLIKGEIAAKCLSVLFGQSGAGKSFVALDYALQIASHYPVMYVAAEGQSGYRDRKNAWLRHHHQANTKLYFCLNSLPMLDKGEISSFIEAIRPVAPVLVVIDTLAQCMVGGDENTQRDMSRFINACQFIMEQLGAAVLVVHHTVKNGTSERGSGALRGASDTMIELTNDDGLIRLSCSKSKDTEPFPDRFLQLLPVPVDEGRSSCVVIAAEKVLHQKGERLSPNQRSILETLNMNQFQEAGASVKQINENTQIVSRSIHRTLDRLMEWNYVRQGRKGEPYFITDEGKQRLGVRQ